MGQTAEHIRDNIVKITDENGNFKGTGFLYIKNIVLHTIIIYGNLMRYTLKEENKKTILKEDSKENEDTLQNGLKNFQTCKKT